MTTEQYFFDIPVYRLTEEKYAHEMDHFVDRSIFPPADPISPFLRERELSNSSEYDSLRNRLRRKYGGWAFNEIIGFIRLFFLGSQIRGEYFGLDTKKICRTRTKVFTLKSLKLAPEIEITDLTTNTGILSSVLAYLVDCRKELNGRYVDSRFLEQLGPHIDWLSFIRH